MMNKGLIFIIILVIFSSCDQRYKYIKNVDKEMKLDILVESTHLNRGQLFLNEQYGIFTGSYLINNDSVPKWLKINPKNIPVSQPKNKKYLYSLTDIKLPYRFLKYDREESFYIIKYQDTLKFKLIMN